MLRMPCSVGDISYFEERMPDKIIVEKEYKRFILCRAVYQTGEFRCCINKLDIVCGSTPVIRAKTREMLR